MEKPFVLFAGEAYYPIGGWDDYRGDFASYAEAVFEAECLVERREVEWWHVIDLRTKTLAKA